MSERQKSALIAEDDDALRRMMMTVLRPFGLHIDQARDGAEAVQRLRERPYDVVIVDLRMPRLDGYVVLRFLEETHSPTRAIVTSAVRSEELKAVARSGVVQAVLSKPFDITAFSHQVQASIAAHKLH